jgi:hypothetical protein
MNMNIKDIANQTLTRLKVRTKPKILREHEEIKHVHSEVKEALFCSPSCSNSGKQSKAKTWNEDDRNLIDWFLSSEETLPQGPFELKPGVKIIDPKRFYESIKHDITCGPKNGRTIFNALQEDLKNLKKILLKGSGSIAKM